MLRSAPLSTFSTRCNTATGTSIPVAFELVKKSILYSHLASRKPKRKCYKKVLPSFFPA